MHLRVTNRCGLADEHFSLSESELSVFDVVGFENCGNSVLGGSLLGVGPGLLASHLVSVQETLIGLSVHKTSTSHTNVLDQTNQKLE